jgi:ribose/xylose/arabinose/galactoside ABC-type transport system permease subunit
MRGLRFNRTAGLAIAVILVAAIVQVQASHYLTPSNLRVLAVQLVSIGIAAVGSAFVVASGNVDVSIGSMFSLLGVCSAWAAASGMPWMLALLVGPLAGGVLGAINGVAVSRLSVSPIVVTLGALSLYAGIVVVLTGGNAVKGVPAEYMQVGEGRILGIPIIVVILVAVFALGFAVANRLNVGRRLLAVGSNPKAALSVGISVKGYTIGVYCLNGVLIGLAAALSSSRFGTASPTAGVGFELLVLTAVLLGGVLFTGGVAPIGGVLLAVILITEIRSGLIAIGLDPTWTLVVMGVCLVGAVALNQFTEERRERLLTLSAIAEDEPSRRAAHSP